MKFIVTRPEPGNARTCAALAKLGLTAVSAPLFVVKPLAHQLPAVPPDAILISSAHAAAYLDPSHAKRLTDCPVFAVGKATEQAARKAGFSSITTGSSDLGDVADLMAQTLPKGSTILRLSAPDRNDDALEKLRDTYTFETVLTYQAVSHAALPERIMTLAADNEPAAFLHFSRRAAVTCVALCKASENAKWLERCVHICISVDACLPDFKKTRIAAMPTEQAMLEIAENTAKRV